MATWSGSYTNELVTSTPYQAANGIRGVIDLDVLGNVTVTAPPELDSASFSLWWVNNSRNTLTINAGIGTSIQQTDGVVGGSASTTIKNGVAGFTFIDGGWKLSDFVSFRVPLGVQAGVTFTPRSTNGLCTLDDAYRVATVERTGIGLYTVTSDGTDISDMVVQVPQPFAIGLPADQKGESHVAGKTATTVSLVIGRRNNGGVWLDDDLTHDITNRVSLFVVKLA